MLDRHSCHTCKARQHNWERELVWRGIDARPTAHLWYGYDDPTTPMRDTEIPSQAAGSAWREHRRAMRIPMQEVRQLQRDESDTFLAQGMGRHYAWAGSNQDIQRSGLTKRRSRRLNRCRPTIALTMHRHDDDNGGAQTMAIQNNNAHRPYVSF